MKPERDEDAAHARLRARADAGRRHRDAERARETKETADAAAGTAGERRANLCDAVAAESIVLLMTVASCTAFLLWRFHWFSRIDPSGIPWLFGAIALIYAARYVPALWLVPRERRFAARLPVEVRGYLERLEQHPSRTSRAIVEVELTNKPSAALLAEVRALAERARAEVDDESGCSFRIRGPEISAGGGKLGPTNAPLRRGQRRLLQQVVLPLLARAKVRSVTFTR